MKSISKTPGWFRLSFYSGCLALATLSFLAGCKLPGKPGDEPEVPRPEEVRNFDSLYSQNCAGCHGASGENGAAIDLRNPTYQALADDATLKDIITNGEKGTLMPAFGVKRGGELTDAQVDALVKGMRERWAKANALAGQNMPSRKASHEGNLANGQQVYAAACAQCHGESARQPGKDGSILDGSYLALVNDQTIRTIVIAGRPDLHMPDWRSVRKGSALTDQEITDLTTWMVAQKPALPGQPYANAEQGSSKAADAPAGKEQK